jgi:hypothetical protein
VLSWFQERAAGHLAPILRREDVQGRGASSDENPGDELANVTVNAIAPFPSNMTVLCVMADEKIARRSRTATPLVVLVALMITAGLLVFLLRAGAYVTGAVIPTGWRYFHGKTVKSLFKERCYGSWCNRKLKPFFRSIHGG